MTTSYIEPRIGVDQLISDVANLRVQLGNAILSPQEARVAVRALTVALRNIQDQCDEYAAKIESLKTERCELYRLIDALRAEGDDWRAGTYSNQLVPS
jgi:hypothetical protein